MAGQFVEAKVNSKGGCPSRKSQFDFKIAPLTMLQESSSRTGKNVEDLPRLIYHRRALSNELLLRAVTGTSFFTIGG